MVAKFRAAARNRADVRLLLFVCFLDEGWEYQRRIVSWAEITSMAIDRHAAAQPENAKPEFHPRSSVERRQAILCPFEQGAAKLVG